MTMSPGLRGLSDGPSDQGVGSQWSSTQTNAVSSF